METTNHPARKIKSLLKTYTMTVQELSERLGVTLESLREILDERAMPTPRSLRRIASLFGVAHTIFGEAALSPPPPAPAERGDFDFAGPAHHGAPAAPARPAPGGARGQRLRRRKKLDLAELAARHQALLDLLLDKKVFTRDEFQMRLEIIRAKVIERRASAKTR